jgi:hypothetical protein
MIKIGQTWKKACYEGCKIERRSDCIAVVTSIGKEITLRDGNGYLIYKSTQDLLNYWVLSGETEEEEVI